jgi:hypothetical protein
MCVAAATATTTTTVADATAAAPLVQRMLPLVLQLKLQVLLLLRTVLQFTCSMQLLSLERPLCNAVNLFMFRHNTHSLLHCLDAPDNHHDMAPYRGLLMFHSRQRARFSSPLRRGRPAPQTYLAAGRHVDKQLRP